MEIRYILPDDDLSEIGGVYERSWKYAYKNIIPQDYLDRISGDGWIDGINKDGRKSVVAVENGMIIGTSCFCRSRWENYAGYGEIVSLYLLPEYMGKGYGGDLLSGAVKELNLLGFQKILLWVLEDNKRAWKFYEKHGFVFSGEYKEDNIGGKKLREMLGRYQ